MSKPACRRICLEVERKFANLKTYPLTRQGGSPPFHSLQHQGHRTFRDVYYDHRGQLAASGTWIRRRDGQWQSKIRHAGDFCNSAFQETSDVDEIRDHVSSIVKGANSLDAVTNFGLKKFADITTQRETWRADDRFSITLDRTDFGHVVGEVELEEHVEVQSDEEISRITTRMDHDIAAFMQRYRWAFDASVPVGKLTAYQRFHHAKASGASI